MQLRRKQGDLALNAGAIEVEVVLVPTAGDAEAFGQFVRNLLHGVASFPVRHRVRVVDVDVGHADLLDEPGMQGAGGGGSR